MKVTDLLEVPLYTGSPVTSEVPGEQPIALGGHPYVLEPSLYQRITVERFRNPYSQSQEPGEADLSFKGAWKRSAERWNHGMGQDFWDQYDSDRARFRLSKGIDVWSAVAGEFNQNRAQLLHDTRNIRSSANTNLVLLSVNTIMYVADGQQVYKCTDPTGATPTFTSVVIHNGEAATTVNDLTTNGTVVWAALGVNGIHQTTVGATTSTHFSAFAATACQYANGRLLAANLNQLVEIDAAGVSTTILTHANTSFVWTNIVGAPNGIYAGGNAGDRAELYFIGLKADHSLDVPRYAATLPDGETLNTMFFYNGVMLIATSRGLRLATVTSADGLSYGSVVKVTNGIRCLEPQAEFCWFGWTNYDSGSTGLGRASLAAFTGDLVPAYSTDLMATAQGTVTSVVTYGPYRYFAVAGAGVFAEFANLVSSGTIQSGWINFSTTEKKVSVSVDVRHEPLAGSIGVSMTQETGAVSGVGTSATQASLGPDTPMASDPISSESFELTFTFTRSGSDATLGPILRWWIFRALITPWRPDEIHIPIILRTGVEVTDFGDGHQVWFDPLAEWLFLKNLESTGAPVTYQEGTQSYVGYIEQVEQIPDKERQWTPDRSFLEGLVVVRFITLSPAA